MVPRVLGSHLGANWRTCVSSPLRRSEHISVLETRACVAALTLVFRKLRHHHRRWLFLSDSVASILGAGKGRSSRPGMCRALRQVCALVLCTGIVLNVRWIPSELNDADRPSRRGLSVFRPPHGGFSGCIPEQAPHRAQSRRLAATAASVAPRGAGGDDSACSATITEVPGKSRRLLTCDPALIAGTPRAPTTGMTPDGLVFHPAYDAVAPGVAGSRKRGLEVHTPHRASTARAAKRRRFASLMEQGDEITALPGRTRLEALNVSRPTRL